MRKKSILWGLLGLLSISCKQKVSEPAIFLLPDRYIGEVIVVYDYPEEEEKYEEDKRLYIIEKNGVLKTKFKASYGLVKDKFFYMDKNGKRKEIFSFHEAADDQEICIYNKINSTVKISNKEYEVFGFMVCPKDAVNMYNEFTYKEIDIDVVKEKKRN